MNFIKCCLKKPLINSLVMAFLYSSIVNGFLLYEKYEGLKHTNIGLYGLLSYGIALFSCFIFFYGFSFFRRLYIINILLASCIGFGIIYAKLIYNMQDISNLLLIAIEDIGSFLDVIELKFIFLPFILYLVYFLAQVIEIKITVKDLLWKGFALILVYLILHFNIRIITEDFVPYNLISSLIEEIKQGGYSKNKKFFQEDSSIRKSQDALDIVFIIGESARSDHFSLNGYLRETNPKLSKINNLVSYKNVTSCANLTRIAVPCMLSRWQDYKNNKQTEPSFISIFTKLGFNSFWLGNQGGFFSLEDSLMQMAHEANSTIIPSRSLYQGSEHDEVMLPYLDDFLNQKHKANLVVIHTGGSHYHYESRYGEKYKIYQPICKKKPFIRNVKNCPLDQIINSYDNTILYTDNFIAEVIERFKERNAVVVYMSDHGESLGENGIFLHGTANVPEQFSVPLIFWFSDSYIKHYPSKVENIFNNKDLVLSYKNIFHTILDLGDIDSNLLDSKMAISSIIKN